MYDLNVLKTEKVVNKVKKTLAFVFAFFLIFSIITSISANAAIEYDAANEKYTINGTEYLVADNQSRVFGGLAMKLVYFTYGGLLNSLSSGSFFTIDTESGQLWGVFWAAYDSIASVGMALAVLWMMIDLMERVSAGQYNYETLIKIVIKFLACAFIIEQGRDICTSFITFGNDIYDAFKTEIVSNGDTSPMDAEAARLFNEIKTGHIITCVGIIGSTAIPAIAMLACFFVALTTLIGRFLELGIRIAFAPIGIADIFAHGVSGSPGVRYLKGLAGCASQGAAMFLIIAGGTILMSPDSITALFGSGTTLSNFFSSFVWAPQLLIALAMIGIMKRVDSILSHAFG